LAFLFIVALFIGIGCGLVNGLFIMNNTVPSFLKFPVRLYL
jgi:ribose/xylose/arabinose/galactoside ABC-type transport system permease subunit